MFCFINNKKQNNLERQQRPRSKRTSPDCLLVKLWQDNVFQGAAILDGQQKAVVKVGCRVFVAAARKRASVLCGRTERRGAAALCQQES